MKNLMFVGKGWKVRQCRSDRCKSVSDEMTLCRVACREPEKISRRSIPKKEVTSHVLLKVAGWIAFTRVYFEQGNKNKKWKETSCQWLRR